ncbi:hypothetical protein WR25_10888 [Diploscapter pachys]|uniref:Major facilitator superfamily (MFS) profile domain-containing protein n=1 Tax=Diploscapter pachys TaxID=2018661 RepID=A0A2A2LZX7_9BILA|nr:hypothetical protein WR25_10888 [Diploscapter pachys]
MSVSLIFSSMFAVASLFTNSLESFTFVRILVLFFNGGLMATFNVYLMEHMPHKYRFWVATIISWAPNFTIIAILAWLTQDWRLLQMVHSFCIIPAFIIILAMRESPRWLIQRGRIFEARRILDRMLKYNNVSDEVYAKMHNLLDSEYRKQMDRPNKVYDMRKLFSRKKMSIATAILCLGNVEFFGRKIMHFLSQFLIAVCMAVIAGVIIYGVDPNSSDVVRVATLAATIITSQVFITKSIVTIEYYPTLVRNSAMGLSSTCSRIGSIIAPLIFYFTDIPFIPYLILSIAALADAILFQIVLPETKEPNSVDKPTTSIVSTTKEIKSTTPIPAATAANKAEFETCATVKSESNKSTTKSKPEDKKIASTTAAAVKESDKKVEVKEEAPSSTTSSSTATQASTTVAVKEEQKVTGPTTINTEAKTLISTVASSTESSTTVEAKEKKEVKEQTTVKTEAETTSSATTSSTTITQPTTTVFVDLESKNLTLIYEQLLKRINSTRLSHKQMTEIAPSTFQLVMGLTGFIIRSEDVISNIALEELRNHFHMKPQSFNYTGGIVEEEFTDKAEKENFDPKYLPHFQDTVVHWTQSFGLDRMFTVDDLKNTSKFVNENVPEVRQIYRVMFSREELYQKPVNSNETIDEMFKEMGEMKSKIRDVFQSFTMKSEEEYLKTELPKRPMAMFEMLGSALAAPFMLMGGLMMNPVH